jgi:tight adherence protein C
MEQPTLIVLGIFAVVTCAAYALLAMFDPYWLRVRSRVVELQRGEASDVTHPKLGGGTDGEGGNLATLAIRLFEWFRGGDRSRTHQRLAKAGLYHPSALSRYFAAKLLLMAVPAAAAVALGLAGIVRMDLAMLAGCIAGGFGSLVPSLWLDRRVAHRQSMLRKALPDFLDLMVVCLEGGMSLQEAMRRVGDELKIVHPTLAFELSVVQRDIEMGATVDQALKRFAARTDHEGVRSLSTFIKETQRFGTNITEALRSHSDMLRSQREQLAEERAQKASVKILLPTMLLIFPAIFVVMVGPAAIQIHDAFTAK